MPLTAEDIWRDFETAGIPASGAHKPVKADIRAWGTALEATSGLALPGADVNSALFSQGAGVPPVYRKIVGFDLPNPSTTTPGGVFAKPGAAGQIVSGLGGDGELDLIATVGTGPVVLQNNPQFTGSVFLNGASLFTTIAGYSSFLAPDGRNCFQVGAAADPTNYYKAQFHRFYSIDGTDLFATFTTLGLDLGTTTDRVNLTGAQANAALAIYAGWNTTGTPNCLDISIADTASNAASKVIRARTGAAGTTDVFSVDKSGNVIANNSRVNGALTFGDNRLVTVRYPVLAVNANAVGDTPVTINLPGVTRFRLGGIVVINVGTTASLTTAAAAVYTAPAAGGTALVAPTALAGLTTNALGTQGNNISLPGTNFTTTIWANNQTFYFRITTAQGAAATIEVYFNIEPYP